MKKPSLSFELEGMLRKRQDWVHISELEDFGRSLGFLSSNVDRRLRELRKAERVVSEIREGKTTWWKHAGRWLGIGITQKESEVNQIFKQISMRL